MIDATYKKGNTRARSAALPSPFLSQMDGQSSPFLSRLLFSSSQNKSNRSVSSLSHFISFIGGADELWATARAHVGVATPRTSTPRSHSDPTSTHFTILHNATL